MLTGVISIYEGHVHLLKKKKKERKKEIEISQLNERGPLVQVTLYHMRATQGNGEGYGKEILLLFFQI